MEAIYITINGIPMTAKEYRTYKASKRPKKAVKRRNNIISDKDIIKGISNEINALYKRMKIIESLKCFYNNGYRQWGTSFTFVINIKDIRNPLVKFIIAAKKVTPLIDEIELLSKKGSKSVFQIIEELTYKLDDVKTALVKLCEGVDKSEVVYGLAQRPCIYENGKRLGLSVLMSRAYFALSEIDEIISKMKDISKY